MSVMHRMGIAVLAIMWSCGGCKPPPPKAEEIPPPVVSVAVPLEREITDYLDFTGNTAAFASVQLRARVKGFLESIHFSAGARMNKDDLLFVIDPKPFKASLEKAEADLKSKEAVLQLAEFDYNRLKKLYEQGDAAEYEYNSAVASRNSALAGVAGAKAAVEEASLNLDYTQVKAPISGRISRNLVDVGNLVGAGENTLLATIVNDDSVYAYFTVSELDLLALLRHYPRQLASTQPHTQKPPVFLALADEKEYVHQGIVDSSDPQLDPGTGTLQVRAILPNPDGLLTAGLFVRLRAPVSRPRTALLVSERALGLDQGQRYVLVVNEQQVVEYRRVQTGALEQGLRVIVNGLNADEQVIVNGLQRVRPGVKVSPQRVEMDTFKATGTAAVPATGPGH
ncbi:MAG: efflux RND transporter periplasmic adaptor subunit [Phycisphaerales bacterium]|nr:efflux RND transporter periplasmic adaptor subunit [Phycisphaerales bacterium]